MFGKKTTSGEKQQEGNGQRKSASDIYLISEEQLQEALLRQRSSKKTLVEILREMNLLTASDLTTITNLKVYAIPCIKLSTELFNKEVLDMIPKFFCLEHKLLPISYKDNSLTIVIADPMNVNAIERLRDMVHGDVKITNAEEGEILDYINQLYPEKEGEDKTEEMLLTVKEITEKVEEEEEQEDAAKPDSGPVVRLVDSTLRHAMERGASDIHWEPFQKESVVRFRIDGNLVDYLRFPKSIHSSVVSRIKILAGIDIAETRRPQDGRCYVSTGGRKADLRIATIRSIHGEKVVIRILNKGAEVLEIEKSGLSQYNYDLLMDIAGHSQGMILLTGPTGSGKTTTLYSILKKIMDPSKNIVTIEDPVEYQLPRVNQLPIHAKAGVSFATILRTVLRQDPDVIMVGEIRDLETAEIAVQAALTGHLVLSTLHTNDAPGAVNRLIDLGVKPYLVTDAVTGVVAQRLVRQICANCREMYEPTTEENVIAARKQIQLPATLYRGKGCPQCSGLGYKGRTGVHEILKVSYRVRHQILSGDLGELPVICFEEGMIPLIQDALQKVAAGITSFEEVLDVVG